VDRTRQQLRPIHTLTALADSFARESLHLVSIEIGPTTGSTHAPLGEAALEIAYLTRWIELDAGRELHGWRTLCRRAVG
jgi:hypothetical protein